MGIRVLLLSGAACAVLIAGVALLLDWSFSRAAILAPVIVLVAGAGGFLVVLWTRIVWESLGARRRR